MVLNAKTAPKIISGAADFSMGVPLVPRVPEDHVAAFLAFHGCEVRIDPAGADLRVGEGQRDIFASRRLCLAHPAAADFGRGFTGIDAVLLLSLEKF